MINMDQSLRILIMADDLTGAADSAARCVGAGLSAEIALRPGDFSRHSAATVCAISSDTRHQSAESAAAIVRGLVAQYRDKSTLIIYKKIDSTLRGHLGAELDALLAGLGSPNGLEPCAIVCPAFPAQQRGVEGGYLLLADAQSTELGEISLPARLREQSKHTVAHIGLAQVRNGPDALAGTLRTAYQAGARLLALDGITESDLTTIVVAARMLPQAVLCGSAGLVGALARQIVQGDPAKPDSSELTVRAVVPPGPIWIVVGSGSSMAQQQIAAARQTGLPCYDVLSVHPSSTWQNFAWQQHDLLLLHLPVPDAQAELEGPAARRLAEQLAQAVQAGRNICSPGAVVVVGGDTAQSVLPVFDLHHLQVVAEVQPGMPLVRGIAPEDGPPYFIMKSGNHGEEETLLELVKWLRSHQS
jgi:D-threonate/D-erythronate kinase